MAPVIVTLLVVFVFQLIAYVPPRGAELRQRETAA
jgi:hypothetical protein